MKAVQVSRPGGDFELVDREIPEPEEGQVRIEVEACGVCHSDSYTKEGTFPGIKYPRIPGHEVAGFIDKVGERVTAWKTGQRVGVGWHGGHCFQCESCRRGDFATCKNRQIAGISYDGGYAEYTIAPQEALVSIPEEFTAQEAAPFLCAGITTFNALRNSGARAGDIVAVQGVGGLGHLAIQFANKLGFKTVALSRGKDKEALARQLGAHFYIDTASSNIAQELTKLGGARVILATAPSAEAISATVEGLATNGKLLIVAGSGESLRISSRQLLATRRSIQGWTGGHAKDSEDTLNFSLLSGVRPLIETFPLEKASVAYERMMSNLVRFRAVLTMNS
jgi:D-arabinose 1-dehydrogenase-like Zn-dependent alcohol dehydrogenase